MSRLTKWDWCSVPAWYHPRSTTRPRAVRPFVRRLRFEPLEERRLLSVSGPFAQASWITGAEFTVLTANAAGDFEIYYRPNVELGFLNPATGDLLTADFYPGTSTVFAIDAVANGNVSDWVGLHYSNGQLVATDGGNTVYHEDGSIMRSGGTWTYDAGASLKNGATYNWSNGVTMITGSTYSHPNGAVLHSGSSLFYATGAAFQSGASLFYPGGTRCTPRPATGITKTAKCSKRAM